MDKTLIIKPISSLGIDAGDEAFARGVTDELLFVLSNVRGIRVASRTSSYYLVGKMLSLAEVSEQLGADYILEGSARMSADQIRISIQLTEIDTEDVLINKAFTTDLGDTIGVQSSIAATIAEELQRVFDYRSYSRDYADSGRAHELVLQGTNHWFKYTAEAMVEAKQCFDEALEIEPEYARAHAGLAKTYLVMGATGVLTISDAIPLASESAKRALLINNKLVEPHLSMAWVSMYFQQDLLTAKRHIDQALLLNPNDAEVRDVLSKYYILLGRLNEAEREALVAIELDPVLLTHHANLFRIQTYLGRFDEALIGCRTALEIDPTFSPSFEQMGWIYSMMGEMEKAVSAFSEHRRRTNSSNGSLAGLAYAYARAGFMPESRGAVAELKRRSKDQEIDWDLANAYLGSKDYDNVYKHMVRVSEYLPGRMSGEVLNSPLYNELKSIDRFKELFRSVVQRPEGLYSEELSEGASASVVELVSATSETMLVDPRQVLYVQADDNYCTVFTLVGNRMESKTIRTKISTIEEQFASFESLKRCHRSYIVNLDQTLEVSGNSRGYQLKSPFSPVFIPVSRGRASEVLEALNTIESQIQH